ncbi:MAG: hypothetical protein ACRCT1_06075 [Microcoleaceae cyanobacterium]
MVAQVRYPTKSNKKPASRGKSRKLSESLSAIASTEVKEEKKSALLGIPQFEELEIALINRKSGTQPRGYIDKATVESYADSMLDKYDQFPPIVVFYDGSNHYVADGFHRIEAAELNQRKTIKSDIRSGTLEEAQWFSYAANSLHGLRRTNEDKRRAVESALKHPNAANMTDSSLGKYLGVSEATVRKYRDLLGVEKAETRTVKREGKDGKIQQFQQSVSSQKRSENAARRKDKVTSNKYEFWEQNGEWEIIIPDDLLSSKIAVTFTVRPNSENEKYEFVFSDKQKALLSENRIITIAANEEKQTATPFLYAQRLIKEWVDTEEERKKKIFRTKEAGFLPGVRVAFAGKQGNISLVQGDGNLCVRFDDGEIVKNEDPSNLQIIPVKLWSVGDVVKISQSYQRTNREFWCRQEKVQVTQTHDNNLYEIKDFNRAEGKRRSLIFHWWEIEGIQEPATEIENQPDITTEVAEVVEKIDYYLRAIGCLPELSDQDLLQLKAALDREIKLRNLEVVDDLQKFQSELVKYAASQGKSSPEGWAHTVIKNHKSGEISPLWEDFVQGRPLGSGSAIKRDWEIESGEPYPAFKEERIQYWFAKGEPIESATLKAGNELRNPEVAKDLWEGFLRKSDRIANDALKAKYLGATPYLPPSFSEGSTVTKESVMAKLEAVASESHSLPAPSESEEPAVKPTIEQLQKMFNFAATKGITIRRINENPQWGYEIMGDKVVPKLDNKIAIIRSAKDRITAIVSSDSEKIQAFEFSGEKWIATFISPPSIAPSSFHWEAYFQALETPSIEVIDNAWIFENGCFKKGGDSNA